MTSSLINTQEIRKFGCVALIFFGSLSLLGLWRDKLYLTVIFGLLAILGIGFVLLPTLLGPIYREWLRIAHLIGRFVNIIILSIVYYLVITPFAFGKRFFGGRPLPLKPNKNQVTYWVKKMEPAQPRDRFEKRF